MIAGNLECLFSFAKNSRTNFVEHTSNGFATNKPPTTTWIHPALSEPEIGSNSYFRLGTGTSKNGEDTCFRAPGRVQNIALAMNVIPG